MRRVRDAVYTAAMIGCIVFTAGVAKGAFIINEVFINPPGTDDGQEYFEIKSDTGAASLANRTLVIIEGDGASAGSIDAAINLGPYSTGSNGIFLWRDAASTILPAPDSNSIIHNEDINPDIENGSNTFLLVTGFTGTVGTDLDAGNDGTLDSTPWTSVDHVIGFAENDTGTNVTYAAQFGFTALPAQNGTNGFNADALFIVPGLGLVGADVLGTNPGGPYNVDAPRVSNASVTSSYQLTPGNDNPSVPEPASLGLVALGGMLLMRRRNQN